MNKSSQLITNLKNVEKYGSVFYKIHNDKPINDDVDELDYHFDFKDGEEEHEDEDIIEGDDYNFRKDSDPIAEYDKTKLEEEIDSESDSFYTNWAKEENVLYLSRLIYEFINEYDYGDHRKLETRLKEISDLIEIETVFDHLMDFEIEPEHVIKSSLNVLDLTDFDTGYKLKKIIHPNLIKDLGGEIIHSIAEYPELMFKLEPRLFEELIYRICKKMNLNPILTKPTRDGGADIIAFEDNFLTQNKYLIECKRYRKDKKVTVETVRSLYGVKCSENAHKGIIVTTSSFTKPARDFAKRHPWDLELKDFRDITAWLKTFYK